MIHYPFLEYPAAGDATEVAEGIYWMCSPLPFKLNAINLYLLQDAQDWGLIDCGYASSLAQAASDAVWRRYVAGGKVSRLWVTHFHPDHLGNSAWIHERWGVFPTMTQAEWFSAQIALNAQSSFNIDLRAAFYAQHGLPPELIDVFKAGCVPYAEGVRLPPHYHRIREGDTLTMNSETWRVIVGEGHSPEHAAFYSEARKILIAGDALLPEISTNVSVWFGEPWANPLALYIESLQRLKAIIHPETLVLPSHRRPFYGAHQRIDDLLHHHQRRLNEILAAVDTLGAVSTGGLLPILFPIALDGHQIGFAMGEALAHLNYLVWQGFMEERMQEGRVIFVRRRAGRVTALP